MERDVNYNRLFVHLVQAVSALVGDEGRYEDSFAGRWYDKRQDEYLWADELARRLVKRLQLILEASAEKTGKWIKENRVLTSNPPQYVWHCSECGNPERGFSVHILTNHCPACGAKMEVTE